MTNIGILDRAFRVSVGLFLLSLIVLLDGEQRWWGLIGVVPLGTALIGNCPLYSLLGMNTCERA